MKYRIVKPTKKKSIWKKVLHTLYVNASDESYFMRGDSRYVPQGFWDNKHAIAQNLGISGRDLGVSLSFLSEQKLIKNYDGNNTQHIELTPEGFKLAIELEKNNTEKNLSKSNITLSTILVIATIGIFWIGWQSYTPKIFGPSFSCPSSFINDSAEMENPFGNYGNSPTFMRFLWSGNNIQADDTFQRKNLYSDILDVSNLYVPVIYQDNKQTSFKWLMKIKNNKLDTASFIVKRLEVDYSNFIDSLKLYFFENIAKKESCEYQKIDNETYKLVRGSGLPEFYLIPNK